MIITAMVPLADLGQGAACVAGEAGRGVGARLCVPVLIERSSGPWARSRLPARPGTAAVFRGEILSQ